MKVLFIHYGREHLGIEYLSSMLKLAGHSTALALDPALFSVEDNVFHIPILERAFNRERDIMRRLKAYDPDLVAFSPYTGTYPWTLAMADRVKRESGKPIVFGGIHTTLVPEEVIKNDFVDFLILGEGEHALVELTDGLEEGVGELNIPNVWYRRDGEVKRNPIRPPIQDLDGLPLPDKELFEGSVRYRDDYMVMAARGCVYNCTYCCESYLNNLYGKRFFRRRGVESVMGELLHMKKRYNYREVMFFDSILFTGKKWMERFLERYRREVGVPFRCTGHVNFLTEEVARMMKEGGCYCIDFGIQSVNIHTRKEILNRHERIEKIERAFDLCDKYGIRYDVDLMFDLPGEGEEDYLNAVRFFSGRPYLNRLKCYNLSYYPRTEIVNIASRMELLGPEDVKEIERGHINDWFHTDSIRDPGLKAMKRNFLVLYKVLPLMPKRLVDLVIRKRLYRWFNRIPSPLVILAQFAIGIKHRDYRYFIYVMNYLHQAGRWIRSRLPSVSRVR